MRYYPGVILTDLDMQKLPQTVEKYHTGTCLTEAFLCQLDR